MDSWRLNHKPNGTFHEEFLGKVPMIEEKSLLYLGHVMSHDGRNLPNIIHKMKKSIGTQKQIVKLVENLALYAFQSAVIYIEALLRSSILYASETMINVKESDYRALEKI